MLTVSRLPPEDNFRVVEIYAFGQVARHYTVAPNLHRQGMQAALPEGANSAPCRVVFRSGSPSGAFLRAMELRREASLQRVQSNQMYHLAGHLQDEDVRMVGVGVRKMGNAWGVGPHVHKTRFWQMEAEAPLVLQQHGAVLTGICAERVASVTAMQEILMREFGYIRAASAEEAVGAVVGHVRLIILGQQRLSGDLSRPGIHTSAFYAPVALASTANY